MIHNANRLATALGLLTGVLGIALQVALPTAATAATMLPPSASGVEWASTATPATFSLTHIAPRPTYSLPPVRRAKPPHRARLFGYASANADELASPPPAPVAQPLLFSHAALGVAMLDTVSAPPRTGVVTAADSGHLSPAALDLTMPASPKPALPSPLPIALIVALVLLPAGLVLGQALRGPSRRPRPAMRHRNAPQRRIDD